MTYSRFSFSAAIFFVLSLCYVAAEMYFNMSLLDVAGDVRSSPQEIDRLQVFGRAVSAFGCCLLVCGFFAVEGFRLRSLRMRAGFYALFACTALFLLAAFLRGSSDFPFALLAAGGVFIALAGRGRLPVHAFAGIVMMVWPMVFAGQKMLIDDLLVEKSSPETRVNARYVLMLRGAMENCGIDFGDLRLCDAREGNDNLRATRIILGALWMLYPEGIRQDLEKHRDEIVRDAAARGVWFSPQKLYEKYVEKVSAEREKYEKEILETMYAPYEKASDAYLAAADDAALGRQAGDMAEKIDAAIEQAWQDYRRAAQAFEEEKDSEAQRIISRLQPLEKRVNKLCAFGYCPQVDISGMLEKLDFQAEAYFQAETGYVPDIRRREDFEATRTTQDHIRRKVEGYIRDRIGLKDFRLPLNWQYERKSFEDMAVFLLRDTARKKWKEKFGEKIPPGLSAEEFLAKSGLEPLPKLEKLVMGREDFFKNVTLPRHQEIVSRMLAGMEAEKHLYAEGGASEKEGRDYVRAVYVPVIALIISLCVVLMTLARGWWAVLPYVLRPLKLGKKTVRALRVFLFMCFLLAVTGLPQIFPNPHARGAEYQRYLLGARTEHTVIAAVLGWTMHAQPAVYRAGKTLLR